MRFAVDYCLLIVAFTAGVSLGAWFTRRSLAWVLEDRLECDLLAPRLRDRAAYEMADRDTGSN